MTFFFPLEAASMYQPQNDLFRLKKDGESKPYSPVLGASMLNGSMSSLNKKQRYLDYENEQAYLSPVLPVKPLDTGNSFNFGWIVFVIFKEAW